MHRRHKIIVLEFAFFACGIVSILIWKAWNTLKTYGYESCVESVAADLHRKYKSGTLEPKNYFENLPENGSWKWFDEPESETILSQIQATDCRGAGDLSLDLWHPKLIVGVRGGKEYPMVLVWSKGPDGVSGTEDDIIAPFGNEIP